MKMLFVFASTLMSSLLCAQEFELGGSWYNPDEESAKPIRIMKVSGAYHFTSKENFVFSDGALSHTIEHSIKIKATGLAEFSGTVDVHDTRGCSFKGLSVIGEFQSIDEVNLLITYPRYKFMWITTGPTTPYYRPIYCQNHWGHEYVCGRERVKPSTRTECRLVETVEVGHQFRRLLK